MSEIVNITDKLQLRNLKFKIDRLEAELQVYHNTISTLRNENNSLYNRNLLLKDENEELKQVLKQYQVDITYG